MLMRFLWLMSAFVAAAPLALAQGEAHNYPVRPIRFIVPYAPGGSSDIIARLYGQRLAEVLGQQFVVDNRPGAGGVVGTAILAKATGDGYTLILQDMPHTINPAVYGKVPYDPVKDFAPITLVGARLACGTVSGSQEQARRVAGRESNG